MEIDIVTFVVKGGANLTVPLCFRLFIQLHTTDQQFDFHEKHVTTGQTDRQRDRRRRTDGQTYAGQRIPYVPLCF